MSCIADINHSAVNALQATLQPPSQTDGAAELHSRVVTDNPTQSQFYVHYVGGSILSIL
jgi:hypothetical protein